MATPDLHYILQRLGIENHQDAIAQEWAESQACFQDLRPAFLAPKTIQETFDWIGIDDLNVERLLQVADRIAKDECLLRLAWHGYWRLVESDKETSFQGWPQLAPFLGEDAGLFYLLIGLALVPHIRSHHLRMKLDKFVTRETCLQFRCYLNNHRQFCNGRPGIHAQELAWMKHYAREPYFRLGRLEFWYRPYSGAQTVFRDCQSGAVVCLSPGSVWCTEDGFIMIQDQSSPRSTCWRTVHEVNANSLRAHPVLPNGRVGRKTVTLNLNKWQCVLETGKPILDLHFPSGGGLTLDTCRDSHARAEAFFDRLYPDAPFVALVSSSWIFNPGLDGILPWDSNLVRYQRQVYRFPVPSTGRDGLTFFYGEAADGDGPLPRDTSLQRRVADSLDHGVTWRSGGMILLREHLDRFGTFDYMDHWCDDRIGFKGSKMP